MASTRHDPSRLLKDLMPVHGFFIGLDSDGCVFDSMELKQKECFCPRFIDSFSLQPISGYAREAWEFVNLYSTTRGCNRYLAILHTLALLREYPGIKASGTSIPRMEGLKSWLQDESKPGMAALKAELDRTGNADLELVYHWSQSVDEAMEHISGFMLPFSTVRESLEALQGKADVVVISQTPQETLKREWRRQNLDGLVSFISGQEFGSKTEQLALATRGKYPASHILMMGDTPGDREAARSNGVLFYPVVPGHEESSWHRFRDEAAGRFFAETYDGDYQKTLHEDFNIYIVPNDHQ